MARTQSWKSLDGKWCLVSWLAVSGVLAHVQVLSPIASSADCALAQIVPDTTLGSESSAVTSTGAVDQINGGATRGANLFHSFQKFNVDEGRAAVFTNSTGIENILSRVTGANPSNIMGTLGVSGGNANLFLINPNGIIFGPNASLNISGSFMASTASSLDFADGNQFSATASQTSPLLTVSVPLGLHFGANPGRILVQGNGQGIRTTTDLIDTTVGLHVQPDQTLALVGGDVALEGGTLKTAGGRIELGSVAGPGLVSLTFTDKGWTFGYEGIQNFRDIHLSQQAAMDASGEGSGDVQVQGRQVTLTNGSQIETSTLSSGPGGTLTITASELVELIGKSADSQLSAMLVAQVYPGATGIGGNVIIKTGRLSVRDGAQILVATYGTGAAGNLMVNVKESVELIGGNSVGGQFAASVLSTSVQSGAKGAGGKLTLETQRLIIQDGAQIQAASFGTGPAGNLMVNAKESVELIGGSARGPSGLFTSTYSSGATDAGGNLTLETRQLKVRDGAQIQAVTFGAGPAGSLTVKALESVELIGTTANG